MNQNNGTRILLAFVAGAAIGAAIGYFLNSDKKEELIDDLKEGASDLKQTIEANLDKVKEIINEAKKSAQGSNTENIT